MHIHVGADAGGAGGAFDLALQTMAGMSCRDVPHSASGIEIVRRKRDVALSA